MHDKGGAECEILGFFQEREIYFKTEKSVMNSPRKRVNEPDRANLSDVDRNHSGLLG
jgi:hypothetical protein